MHIQHKYSYLTVGSISCHLTKLSFPIRYPVQTKFQKISISNMCQKHHMDVFTLFKLLLFPPQKKKKNNTLRTSLTHYISAIPENFFSNYIQHSLFIVL